MRDYIKTFLANPAQSFYLFTAPPKTVLKDMSLSLAAAQLVPCANIRFGSVLLREATLFSHRAVGCDDMTQQVLSEAAQQSIEARPSPEDVREVVHEAAPASTETLFKSLPKPKQDKAALLLAKMSTCC